MTAVAHAICALIGVWLMAAPAVLGYDGGLRTAHIVAGALIGAFGFVAVWEIMRGLRWLNESLAAFLLVAPFVLGDPSVVTTANSLIAGVVVLALSLLAREQHPERYGGGWGTLLRGGGSSG